MCNHVHINIGTNLGDRRANLEAAVAAVAALPGVSGVRVSKVVESEPWGFESANRFLNVGVSFDTVIEPLPLLLNLQQIERSIGSASHRNPDGSYADRLIDIDIITYGDRRISTPQLTVPHPRAALRDFVVGPYQELEGPFPTGLDR